MKEINLEDLSEWFRNKIRKQIDPIKKEAEKKISKCESIFDELRIACKKLEEQPSSTSDDLITKSAKRFSTKLVNRIDEIEFPEKITYEDINHFKIKLENLLKIIAQYANRWVSKLGRDKTYLQSIRDINYLLRDVQNLYGKLHNFLEKKYRKIVDIENVEELIDRLIDLKKEAQLLKRYESEIRNELDFKESEYKKFTEKFQNLEKDAIINELNLIEKEIEKINGKIRNLIGPIRKPLKKFLKLIESGGFNARPATGRYLTSYLNNPVVCFFSEEDDFPNINSIILDLNDALNSNKIKIKSGTDKKIKNKIKQIKYSNLKDIKAKFKELNEKKQSILSHSDYMKKIQILKELKQEDKELKRELDDIKLRLEKNIEDYNRSLNKIGDYKSKIENSIFKITKTQIKLLI
ncbi:MAG: hypothetical protein ACTSRG_10155 [Candidatus Helarchaeota archaeon]